jgi:hypothetical protein
MKYCNRCGSPCQDGDAVCGNCGFRFTPADSSRGYGAYRDPSAYSDYREPNTYHEPHTNGMAVASLVLGLLGWPMLACRGTGLVFSVLAIIFGSVAGHSIKASRGEETGRGMAIAGLILGIVAISAVVLIFILVLVGMIALGSLLSGVGPVLSGSSGSFTV